MWAIPKLFGHIYVQKENEVIDELRMRSSKVAACATGHISRESKVQAT
jgi:hypothetical protein